MEEILCSIHNYTKLSGNSHSFYSLAQAALDCGLDAVFTTDRNIYPQGRSQYYYRAGKRLLMLCGEELSDPVDPDAPCYLSLGIEQEQFNRNRGNLNDEIRISKGFVPEGQRQPRHIELLNAHEFLRQGLRIGENQLRNNLDQFDALLQSEQRFIAVVGTCFSSDLSPYTPAELFSTACNHILSEEPLSGDFIHDKLLVMKALKAGNLFIALDGIADAKGFRFTAEGANQDDLAYPGNAIYLKNSITLKINIPEACTCRLIRNGKVIKEWRQCKQVPYTIYEPGFYRVECALTRRRELYDWIITNPIYVVKG